MQVRKSVEEDPNAMPFKKKPFGFPKGFYSFYVDVIYFLFTSVIYF